MSECVRRGFVPTDVRDFQGASLCLLQKAQADVAYLLDRGYDVERATAFVGDRFQFSSRQRMALIRATSSHHDVMLRQEKLFSGPLQGKTLWIDGFNTIIPLEAALSGSTVLLCMDGSVRDLCGLHGSYRLIDKTDSAISLLLDALACLQPDRSVLVLDAPVSNSGRLSQRLVARAQERNLPLEPLLVPNADALLWDKDCVATGDAIILNRCRGWVNLCRTIIETALPDFTFTDLSGRTAS